MLSPRKLSKIPGKMVMQSKVSAMALQGLEWNARPAADRSRARSPQADGASPASPFGCLGGLAFFGGFGFRPLAGASPPPELCAAAAGAAFRARSGRWCLGFRGLFKPAMWAFLRKGYTPSVGWAPR